MRNTNRREFLDRSKKGVVGLAASMPILADTTAVRAAQKARRRRPSVVAVYYPHWHNYDHGSAWKGEGWTEWEGVKAAVPRFTGHHQPLKPTWGYFDESDPKWSAIPPNDSSNSCAMPPRTSSRIRADHSPFC